MSFNKVWHFIFFSTLLWSAIHPYDWATWWMEALPAMIVYVILLKTKETFKITPLLYAFILLHSLVLFVGAKYTYARVPLIGDWAAAWGLKRNPYDGIGHFMQGFVPALAAREILIRLEVIKSKKWMFFVIVCICTAISAVYELIEWAAALLLGQGADEFLGTQGDVWDTQKDMFLALIGAITAQISLAKLHDYQLKKTFKFLLFWFLVSLASCRTVGDQKSAVTSNAATDSIWNSTLREPWQSFKEGDATLGLDGFEFKFEKANKQKVPKSSDVLLKNKIWIAKNGSDICAPKDLWVKKKNTLYKAALYGGNVSCELKKHSSQLFLYCINECEGGSEFLSIYSSIDTGDSWRVWNPVQQPWYMAGLEEEKLLESGELELTFSIHLDDIGVDLSELKPLVNRFVARSSEKGTRWTSHTRPAYLVK